MWGLRRLTSAVLAPPEGPRHTLCQCVCPLKQGGGFSPGRGWLALPKDLSPASSHGRPAVDLKPASVPHLRKQGSESPMTSGVEFIQSFPGFRGALLCLEASRDPGGRWHIHCQHQHFCRPNIGKKHSSAITKTS